MFKCCVYIQSFVFWVTVYDLVSAADPTSLELKQREEASEKCKGTRLSPLEVCQLANGRAVVPLSASRSLCVRVKGNEMRGRGEECGGRRTTPAEGTLQECGAAQPVPALTCVPTDVNIVGLKQTHRDGGP